MLLALIAAQVLSPIATVKAPDITEMSGIARSLSYKGVFWVHNDSGDTARIWPIRLTGEVVCPDLKGIQISNAKNVDWEDITLDGKTMYISDLGNNGNKRRDLGVYVLPEPNPMADHQTMPPKFLPIQYPDQTEFPPKQRRFDCEAIFVRNHRLYVLTKHRRGETDFVPEDSTKLYRLDTAFTDRPNTLTKVDEKGSLGGWVTAAGLSPDGKSLAVLTQAPVASVWFFDLSKAKGDKFLSTPSRQVVIQGVKQCEAICFENDRSVIVTNEQRDIFRMAR